MNSALGAITRTIPITLFNRGMAGKIFDEVKKQGTKVVMKNNTAEVVLVSPTEYLAMCNELEDLKLALIASKRTENIYFDNLINQERIDSEFGINEQDLEGYEEVEFE